MISFYSTGETWNATFYLVITPESGEQIRKEVPLISLAELSGHQQTRHRGKLFKYKIKITKLVRVLSYMLILLDPNGCFSDNQELFKIRSKF
jgi:hypothetical protein